MTTEIEAETAVLNRWIAQWGDTTPFIFEEEQQPSTIQTGETAWALVRVIDVPSEQQTLGAPGGRRFLRQAAVSITIYVPSNQGTALAVSLARQARQVFEGTGFDGLSFYPANIERLGSAPPEYLMLVTCPFDYTETK